MRFLPTTLVATAMVMLVLAAPADAATPNPTWHAASPVSLPSGATGVPQGYLPALACPSSGNCVAGGAYTDASGDTQGLLLDEVNGVWRSPVKLNPPTGAATNPTVTIASVSCGSPGNCSVVGGYQDNASNSQSLVANEEKGAWSSATKLTLPANALATGQNSQLHSVACPSAGDCSAVGTYLDTTAPISHVYGMLASEVNGAWRVATEVRLPSGANVNPYVNLSQIACPATGYCTGVGSYLDTDNTTHGLLVVEQGGTWSSGQSLTLPGNASAYANASLSEVTCTTALSCTALGTYTNNLGQIEGLTVTESGGRWLRAVAMRMPAGAAANPHVFFYGYGGLACPSVGNCSAGGQYLDAAQNYQGFLINEVNGSWQGATELVLPTGSQAAGRNGGVVAVSCQSAGDCSAGAAYIDGSGDYQAMVVNEVGGDWQPGQKITLPSSAITVGVDGGVYGLICQTSGSCTATGSYLSTTTDYQGFTVTAA